MPRLLTWNVHSCRGLDGRYDPARIAAVIAAAAPDIVALQELDVQRRRSGGLDQARLIAAHLGMRLHFHPALRLEQEQYGDAVLSALPMRLVRAGPLPGPAWPPGLEPRGALWVAVRLPGGGELQVINTHLGLLPHEQRMQVAALLGADWLDHPDCRGRAAVLLGDFNAVPGGRPHRRLAARLRDAAAGAGRPRGTFPSRWPLLRIDHVMLGPGLEATRVAVLNDAAACGASDHLPLLVELRLADAHLARPPQQASGRPAEQMDA